MRINIEPMESKQVESVDFDFVFPSQAEIDKGFNGCIFKSMKLQRNKVNHEKRAYNRKNAKNNVSQSKHDMVHV